MQRVIIFVVYKIEGIFITERGGALWMTKRLLGYIGIETSLQSEKHLRSMEGTVIRLPIIFFFNRDKGTLVVT